MLSKNTCERTGHCLREIEAGNKLLKEVDALKKQGWVFVRYGAWFTDVDGSNRDRYIFMRDPGGKEIDMATKTKKAFEKALLDLAGEDLPTALSVLTGCFVSLTLEVVRRKGHATDRDIKVDGGDQRDITIHAPNVTPNAALIGERSESD